MRLRFTPQKEHGDDGVKPSSLQVKTGRTTYDIPIVHNIRSVHFLSRSRLLSPLRTICNVQENIPVPSW